MPTIIKDRKVVFSEYDLIMPECADFRARGVILPLGVFLENKSDLSYRRDLGLWLEAGEDIEEIENCVDNFAVIALNFPSFGDGRAYSSANILRRKYSYTGELRAVGDVRRDQIEQMSRCGFDAFAVNEEQDLQSIIAALTVFTYNYQTSIDRPQPLFRLR